MLTSHTGSATTGSCCHQTQSPTGKALASSQQHAPGCEILPDMMLSCMCRGLAQDGYPAIHTVLVDDSRPRSGENAAMARVITKLPFNDTGDSTTFADNYRCQATVSMLACL